jgi:hypothetical protein
MSGTGKLVAYVAAGVVVTVVGGVLLEHAVRLMDQGLIHIGPWYWKPGSEPWKGGVREGVAPEVARGLVTGAPSPIPGLK